MTLVITTGGIDLSVGSIVALVNSTAAVLLKSGFDWPVVVVMMLVFGALIAPVSGLLRRLSENPRFHCDARGPLGHSGCALVLTSGFSILIPPSLFLVIGRGTLDGIPYPALLGLLVAALGYVVLNTTVYGRRIVAVGANTEAARRVGMPAPGDGRFGLCAERPCLGAGGLVIAARLGSGSSNAAVGVELDVIAAVVLGGTSLSGGRGTIIGTILGTLTIAVISNGLIRPISIRSSPRSSRAPSS